MKDEFKEMDDLIHKNKPSTERALKALHLPEKPAPWWKIATIAATAFTVIVVVQNSKMTTQSENLLALNETMSWDPLAADEWPVEMNETMDYLEIP